VTPARCLALLFSLCLHGCVAGILLLFSAARPEEAERVYRVALSELAAPQTAQAAPPPAPEPRPEQPPSEPELQPEPEPKPEPEPPREAETKIISARKTTPPARPKAEPKPAAPELRTPFSGSAPGPRPRQFGGFSAYEQDHVDQRPAIARRAEPEYPARARRMNIEGTTVVELVVDASGLPKACAVRSAAPPGYFEEAALDAARKMRFLPGKLKGVPVNTLVLLPFSFRLR
jgi:protein TonB